MLILCMFLYVGCTKKVRRSLQFDLVLCVFAFEAGLVRKNGRKKSTKAPQLHVIINFPTLIKFVRIYSLDTKIPIHT